MLAGKKLTNREKQRLQNATALPEPLVASKRLSDGVRRGFRRAGALPSPEQIEALRLLKKD
jgi:hypothetical protein